MNIAISEETRKAIDQMIASGHAQSPEQALDVMASFWLGSTLDDDDSMAALKVKLQEAVDDIDSGRVTVLEGTQTLHQHRDQLIANLRNKYSGTNVES